MAGSATDKPVTIEVGLVGGTLPDTKANTDTNETTKNIAALGPQVGVKERLGHVGKSGLYLFQRFDAMWHSDSVTIPEDGSVPASAIASSSRYRAAIGVQLDTPLGNSGFRLESSLGVLAQIDSIGENLSQGPYTVAFTNYDGKVGGIASAGIGYQLSNTFSVSAGVTGDVTKGVFSWMQINEPGINGAGQTDTKGWGGDLAGYLRLSTSL